MMIMQSPTLVVPDEPSEIESSAVRVFAARFSERRNCETRIVAFSDYLSSRGTDRESTSPLFVGRIANHRGIADILTLLDLAVPEKEEGYLLYVGKADGRVDPLLPPNCAGLGVVCGADPRGVLYGIGRLLRLMDCDGPEVDGGPIIEMQSPAVRSRGVYLATHFNNYYERAPLPAVERYVEDLALWGYNTLYTILGTGVLAGDLTDPENYGSGMVRRVKMINEAARGLGMRIGMIGEANEASTCPPDLRATPSPNPYRPYGTVCPSKPGSMQLILDSRRRMMEVMRPIDVFCIWPYDSGGCSCEVCSDEHGWAKTLVKIGPEISRVVKECDPGADVVLATWYMDDAERALVYDECAEGAVWFDGLMMEVRIAGEPQVDPRYSLDVFPEVSMFDCFFTSYGCNGANPAPRRFHEHAKRIAELGYGALLYSEGIYEDINKVIWAATLWNPERTPDDIVAEYCGHYFGEQNRQSGTDLVMGLEGTWGPRKLASTSCEAALSLLHTAESMGGGVPPLDWCRWRWLALMYRAKMDHLMVRAYSHGTERELKLKAKSVGSRAWHVGGGESLREHLQSLRDRLTARSNDIRELLDVYWEYLERFDSESIQLVFRPDDLLGKTDYRDLLDACDAALQAGDDETMRRRFLKGFQRWFWFNSIDLEWFGLYQA